MSGPAFPENTIEVRNLVKVYAGLTAVNDVSFTVRRGEIIGFLGPNGAGKSTSMRILTGYLPATSGYVSICGIPVASRPEDVKRHIGYMPENNPLPEDVRLSEYLYFRGRLKELSGKKLRERINTVIEQCDLSRVRHRIIGTLSKGYKQRVGIAESILAEPDVLIMDEPTIGLDPHQILMIRDLIASLRGRMSVIISSHILPEIEATCDRVLIINSGRIVATGTPEELRREFIGPLTWRVETVCEEAVLAAALGKLGAQLRLSAVGVAEGEGSRVWQISHSENLDVAEKLLAHLAAAPQIGLRSFARNRASLEDVFLAATQRSWEVKLPTVKANR